MPQGLHQRLRYLQPNYQHLHNCGGSHVRIGESMSSNSVVLNTLVFTMSQSFYFYRIFTITATTNMMFLFLFLKRFVADKGKHRHL
jgi:hypothetical protein